MTNEIKEKIEYLKKVVGIYEGARITEIEDYITNLQEENKKYQDDYENLLILGLKQETHFNIKCDDLQQRIDKAIEYISNCGCDDEAIDNIKDILRGDE